MLFWIVLAILTVGGSAVSKKTGSNCQDLSGAWRDDLGSNMTIDLIPGTNRFTGRFVTAVESTPGAQSIASQVSGLIVPVKEGSLVAFNVIFDNGDNVVSWAGQCMTCDGEEKLFTTFVIRFQEEPGRAWVSTLINKNIFFRPSDAKQVVRQLSGVKADPGRSVDEEGLLGTYKSKTGDSFEITGDFNKGCWDGVQPAGGKTPVFGLLDGDGQSFAGFGFASDVGRRRVQVWSGQIEDLQEKKLLLQTSWVKHTFTNNCKDPLKNVNFGMDNYTLFY